ncbi:MAG: hypothetical protein JNJ43_16820 [Anaerolineales bacterium]|nr:hypothetical protein [Anaerolineales bacterium]
MPTPKYIHTVDLDLPPLKSGIPPYSAFSEFPKAETFFGELIVEIRRFWKVLNWARECDVLVLDSVSGSFHPDLLACIFIRLLHKKPVIVLADDMWNKSNFFKYNFQKLIVRLADPVIQRYAVHSIGEGEIFAKLWGIDQKKVRVNLYCFTFTDAEVNAGPILSNGYIFSGGNPARDYDSLLEAARKLPHRKFIISTRLLDGRKDIPTNVQIVKVSHTEFIRLMREADMVITPLVSGNTKSSGQQTYLNAMRLGKISIVNAKNVLGVTDYIQNYVNGITPDGTPEGYCEAIEWVYNPTNQEAVEKIKQKAQESVMEFTSERHLQRMASIVEEAIEEAKK